MYLTHTLTCQPLDKHLISRLDKTLKILYGCQVETREEQIIFVANEFQIVANKYLFKVNKKGESTHDKSRSLRRKKRKSIHKP